MTDKTPVTAPEEKPSKPTRTNSLIPQQKWVGVVAHTVVDVAAIITVGAFVLFSELDETLGATIVALIAGAWVGGRINARKNGNGGGSGEMHASSLVLALLEPIGQILGRLKGAWVLAFLFGCGGTGGDISRAAVDALQSLKDACEVIQVLPVPEPSPPSPNGGNPAPVQNAGAPDTGVVDAGPAPNEPVPNPNDGGTDASP